jgi:2-oxoglutarate ferredoxin oxidoreductase subunit beta
LQELGFIAPQEEIIIEDYEPGSMQVVELHDGSRLTLRKLEADYDQSDRLGAMARLMAADSAGELLTGLVYYDDSRPALAEVSGFGATPLSQLPDESLRPSRESLTSLMNGYA